MMRIPTRGIVLLCVLGMAVILYQVFGPGRSVGGPLVEEAVEESDPRLDPEPYRQTIEALESGLFAPVEDGRDLADAAASLRAGVDALSGEIGRLHPEDAETVDTLAALAGSVADGLGFADLEGVRHGWLRLRDRRFVPARWFLSPSVEGWAHDRVILAEHRELARGLRALLYEGAAAARSFAEAETDDGAAGWREFAADWRQRLDELWRDRPRRPSTDADAELLLATQELERAYRSARDLAADPGLAGSDDPGARFNAVLERIDRVESAFAGVRL